ncbi:hypothetical protein [Nonomuraea aurantiaca]|uniref:hypothetical protein n=1 Tax=Nonomuraea aurantiaca TaxID=2878562 RepID=UPI001CD973DB|nr:hypothetical protein [Nonomuraea aurantiaca]MCA2225916.1 hypothetical protein [Nonomuraea aurantiaca]
MADPVVPAIATGPLLTGYVEPGVGRGVLTFFSDIADPVLGATMEITLTAPPWNTTGHQPFTWRYLPPTAERAFPKIWLAVGRQVMVTTRRTGRRSGADLLALGPRNPLIEIVRPQDDDLIPQPDASVIEMWRLLPQPFTVGPFTDDERGRRDDFFSQAATVNVTTKPLGVVIRNVLNGYAVTIDIDNRKDGRPAAFVYDIVVDSREDEGNIFGDHVTVRVVHTHNVTVRATASQDMAGFIDVQTLRLDDSFIPSFPPQGTVLDNTTFQPQEVEVHFAPEHPTLIFLFELAIQFVPYVNVLYDLSQLTFELATGRDFWGNEVSGGQILVYGITSVLPFAKALPRSVLQSVRTELKTTKLARVLEEDVISEVGRVAEREFLEAVGSMDVKGATDLARMLTRFATGRLSMDQVLRRFHDLVGNAYLRELDRRVVERLLTANFKTFRNPRLAAGFNAFSAKKLTRGIARSLDPISWALSQRGRSRFIQELESELGKDWAEVLKNAKRTDSRLRQLSTADIEHYDRLAGRVEDFRSLAKLNRGRGDLYEVDHILEQRFWRNDPRVSTAFDEKGEGMAMVIPKNPAVAAKMPGKTIAYVHTLKTRLLTELIPNGREAEFTVQQIFDAHMWVLESLRVDRSVTVGDRLLGDFRLLARARRERLELRMPSAATFTPQGGWPVLVGVQ